MPEISNELKIFYCYARKDKALIKALEIGISSLKHQYALKHWYDREISPGADWKQTIDQHLNTADLIFLLISPDFLASEYCYGIEMQRALERDKEGTCCVIPILLRPTYWEDMPFSNLQILPTDAKPITRWPDRDDAFYDVARGIDHAIKERRKRTAVAHPITPPPTNQIPAQEKIAPLIITVEPAQPPAISASSPAKVVKVIPYPKEDEDEEPIQQNPRIMPSLRRSHAPPEDEEFEDKDEDHIGPALATGAVGGFVLADLANNSHRSDPPPSSLISRANQAINLDEDDYALPGGAAIGTSVPEPAPVASASRQVSLPVMPPESEESLASDAGAAGLVAGAAAGPAIIDLGQRKPRTTAQLPPRPLEQQPVPPRTKRRNSPVAGAAGALGAAAFGASQSSLSVAATRTPLTPAPLSGSGPRRPRRWLEGILLLLTFLIVCVSLLYYQPQLFGISAVNIQSGSTPPVTVTIVPASQIVSNSYVITGVAGTPDPKQQEIKAITLNGSAQSQALTANATGHNQTVGKAATGVLTFFNENPVSKTVAAHTVFTTSNGVQLWNNDSVTIPAAVNLPTVGSQDAAATVLSVGANGNIGPKAVNGGCCMAGVSVENQNAFTGGQDSANYNFVTQGDIDAVVTQTVQNQLAQQATNQLKGKLATGELLAESPQCQTSVNSSSPIGDHGHDVATTSVTIAATCDSVAYDDQGMRALVTQLLTQKAQVSPGAGFVLQGNRINIDPKIQSLDPFSLNVNAIGQWVYQIGDQQRSTIIKLIGGKSVEAATAALKGYTGIASSNIQFSSTTTDPNQYVSSFVVNAPTPLPADTTGSGVSLLPTVTNGNTPLGIPGTPTAGVGIG